MIRLAFILIAFVALSALDARPAAAEIYRPWCIQGFVTCTFTSFEQCMMTARATGDSCVQNHGTYGTGAANWDRRSGDKVPFESAAPTVLGGRHSMILGTSGRDNGRH